MAIYHFYSDYHSSDPDTQLRHMVARKTWSIQPWVDRGIKDAQLPRMWREEGRSFPFVQDVWRLGVEGLADDDIAVYTNTDICVVTKVCQMISKALRDKDAVFSYRIDFHHHFAVPIPDQDVTKGFRYPGSDLYAFRAKWWREWAEIFPDLIMGMEGWDPCMRILMQQSQVDKNPELRDTIYHQRHNSFWERAENRNRLSAQRHNLALEWNWLSNLGIDPRKFGLRLI